MSYPTFLDLKAFLRARGLACSDLTDADYKAAIASAIAEWEHCTGWIPFLATSSEDEETRVLDGPEGRFIFPEFGIISLSNVTIGDSELVADESYFLQHRIPNGPYTSIELDGYATGHRRSVSLTGVFGYTSTIPLDVKSAIMSKAAESLYYHITGLQGEVIREKQGPVEFEYSKPASGETNYSGVIGSLKGEFERVCCRYRRARL